MTDSNAEKPAIMAGFFCIYVKFDHVAQNQAPSH